MLVEPGRLVEALALTLRSGGARADIARIVAENLVDADMCGHDSHGSRLVDDYVLRLAMGEVDGLAEATVAWQAGPIARVDGNRAFGQSVGLFAARLGVSLARRHGLAAVAVKRSGHLGRNGKWAEVAADGGVASLHFVNAPGAPLRLAPPGHETAVLASNPVSLGAPSADGGHLILDFSTGAVAVNAVRAAWEQGRRLPEAAILGADGTPTDDPRSLVGLEAMVLRPAGGFKGFGLAVFCELFAGAIGGGGCNTGLPGAPEGHGMLSMFLDPTCFSTADAYRNQIAALCEHLTGGPSGGGPDLRPGARSRRMREASQVGLRFDDGRLRPILAAADRAGVGPEVARLLKKA